MAISKRDLHPGFAVEITGVDMRAPPSVAQVAEIESLIHQYPVVVLPAQDITDEQQREFCRPFGELQKSVASRTNVEARLNEEMTDASNLGKNNKTTRGRRQAPHEQSRQPALAHRRFVQSHARRNIRSCRGGSLRRRVAKPSSPTCGLAMMRCPPRCRSMIEGLVVEHNLLHSRAVAGFPAATEDEKSDAGADASAPRAQAILRTGRKSLYLSSHASHIVGWPKPEGMMLLYELTEYRDAARVRLYPQVAHQ